MISTKKEIKNLVSSAIDLQKKEGILRTKQFILDHLLSQRVRFPLLEYFSECVFSELQPEEIIKLTNEIVNAKTIGGNVIAGIAGQLVAKQNIKKGFQLASEWIATGGEWYSCDLIGERVMGFMLLHHPDKSIPELEKIIVHPVNQVARTFGVALHYATKKRLEKSYVEKMFRILLHHTHVKDYHIKTGLGWGAKTVAKFHEDLIEKNREAILETGPPAWLQSKIKTGLTIAEYRKEKGKFRKA